MKQWRWRYWEEEDCMNIQLHLNHGEMGQYWHSPYIHQWAIMGPAKCGPLCLCSSPVMAFISVDSHQFWCFWEWFRGKRRSLARGIRRNEWVFKENGPVKWDAYVREVGMSGKWRNIGNIFHSFPLSWVVCYSGSLLRKSSPLPLLERLTFVAIFTSPIETKVPVRKS